MGVYKYHPDKVSVRIADGGVNRKVTGLSQDGFITVEFDDDKITKTMGVSGEGIYNVSASKAGAITLSFLQGSPWLDKMLSKCEDADLFYIEIMDNNGYDSIAQFVCQEAIVRQKPVYTYGSEASDVEVVIDCIKLEAR